MRMYLKNNRKVFFRRRVFIIVILLFLIGYIYSFLYRNLNYYYLNYSENEASKIITNSISKAIDDKVLKEIDSNNLYNVVRNKNEEIEMIDYNSYLVNVFLRSVTNNIMKELSKEEKKANEAAFYIPMGSVFQHPVLNNRGPKIPVRMELVGSVITGIDSKIKDYGINNSLVEIYVHIEIKERVILPVSAKDITIVNDIPISYKIIKGQIPSYYNGNGVSYMMPIENN